MIFKRIIDMINDLNSTNSNNDKIKLLAKYSDLKKVLEYTYSPLKQFYITSKAIKNSNIDIEDVNWEKSTEEDFFDLLDKLNKREITGHASIAAINSFIKSHKEKGYEELILNIIDKNLKIRMNASLINKVFPNLIPEFKVQLAEVYEEDKIPDFENENWYYSRKLDGVRCITIYKDHDVKFFSRSGKEFFVLDKVKESIISEIPNILKEKYFKNSDFVLDGEICIVDDNGNENFTNIMKEIRKKDHTIKNPRYKIFDILSFDDFINQKSELTFSERYNIYKNITSESKILDPVEQTKIKNLNHLKEMINFANNHGWEGLIIRKDVPYAGKRTKDMQKIKSFLDAEYKVISIESGPFRFINPDTGLEVEEEMLSSVIIEHKGNKVSVGSGFSIEERRHFFKNPKDIIGKKITVKYFEETIDQNGNPSLRFPTLKAIYGVERDL